MANVKISELPAATYVPPGSSLPVVVSGITKRSTVSQISPIQSIAQYGSDSTGLTSNVTAFQAAMTALSAGGTLYIPAGTYLFTVTGDSDTILVPSNIAIECEPGVIFKWGYWGSPLFAIVNKTNVRMKLNGAKFLWTGTFSTTSGSRDAFNYGRAIPAYEWCSHIISVGSEFVEIEDARCAGNTTSNVQNIFVEFRGKNDGSLTEGNQIRKLYVDDVCQGIIFGEQKRFLIEDIESNSYSSASNALYGPGHLIYVIAGTTASEAGKIQNIMDRAGTAISGFVASSVSVSLKSLSNASVRGLYSRRAEGAFSFVDCTEVDIDFKYDNSATDADTNGGVVFASEPAVANSYVKINGSIVMTAQRNFSPINFGGITVGSKNLYCEVNVSILRNTDGTESTPGMLWVGNYGKAHLQYEGIGSGAAKIIIDAKNTSNDNNFYVQSSGAVPSPKVGVTTGSRNTFFCSGDSTIDYDADEFTPANGNTVIWESARQYQSSQNLGSTTNPTTTFQLPKQGAYLVHINLISSDFNHARAGLYWVVCDDASVSDFTTAALIGSQITKGGSAPSVLTLAVDKDGLCTITSTAGSNTWLLQYGYRQLSAD